MTPEGGAPAGLAGSARGLAATVLAIAANRLSLLGVEVAEERERLVALLIFGISAVLSLGVGLVFLAILVTVLLWESQRALALGAFSALFIGAGAVCALIARGLARRPSALFVASLGELRKDGDALRGGAPGSGV